MNVYAKFKPRTSPNDRARVMRQLRRKGAASAYRLFPRTDDADLAARIVVEVADEAAARIAVAYLVAQPQIEFAEMAARRRPI